MRKKKKKDKKKFNYKKNAIVILVLIVTLFLILSFNGGLTGQGILDVFKKEAVKSQGSIETTGLSEVSKKLLSSKMIKDLPETGVVSLKLFSIENGEKVWQDEILIGNKQILKQGEPDIYVRIDSKYISELNDDGSNLCNVIKKAAENKGVEYELNQNKGMFILKYSGMAKYKECFGF